MDVTFIETIELALDLILSKNGDIKTSRENVLNYSDFDSSGTYFYFNVDAYEKVDGGAIHSLLPLDLANVFWGHP